MLVGDSNLNSSCYKGQKLFALIGGSKILLRYDDVWYHVAANFWTRTYSIDQFIMKQIDRIVSNIGIENPIAEYLDGSHTNAYRTNHIQNWNSKNW